jgi:hypothetical protein
VCGLCYVLHYTTRCLSREGPHVSLTDSAFDESSKEEESPVNPGDGVDDNKPIGLSHVTLRIVTPKNHPTARRRFNEFILLGTIVHSLC